MRSPAESNIALGRHNNSANGGSDLSYSHIGSSTDRFSKTVSGTTTQFLYDNGNVDEEMQGTTVTADYGASAEKLNGTVSWMLQDGPGSTRQLLNSSQTVVASYISDAFGNSVGGSGSSANPFIWNGGSGYYSDAESGLQKVGARYYDAALGRWISQDTLLVAGSAADSQAVNRYAYCEANPVAHVDANGHGNPWQIAAGAALIALGLLTIAAGVATIVAGLCFWKAGLAQYMTGVAMMAFAQVLASMGAPLGVVLAVLKAGALLMYGGIKLMALGGGMMAGGFAACMIGSLMVARGASMIRRGWNS